MKSGGGFHESTAELKRISSKKQEEEWDKDIPDVSCSSGSSLVVVVVVVQECEDNTC